MAGISRQRGASAEGAINEPQAALPAEAPRAAGSVNRCRRAEQLVHGLWPDIRSGVQAVSGISDRHRRPFRVNVSLTVADTRLKLRGCQRSTKPPFGGFVYPSSLFGSAWRTAGHRKGGARQSELIQTWRPCERSTGPRTPEGKARVSQNAYKGARWAVLRELTEGGAARPEAVGG